VEKSLATKISAANTMLITNGNLQAVGDFFTSDYTVHLTGRVMKGGHRTVHDILGALRQSFPDIQVDVDILYPKRLGFRYLVRVIFLFWQGEMTSNSRSIARNFNAARTEIGQQ